MGERTSLGTFLRSLRIIVVRANVTEPSITTLVVIQSSYHQEITALKILVLEVTQGNCFESKGHRALNNYLACSSK